MDKVSRQRRQLVMYLGLGVLGAGATAACGFSTKRTNPSTRTLPIPIADATQTNATLAGTVKAIPDFQGIQLDNEYKTWKAYDNHYWPHLFLADRQGLMRYDYIGEDAYDTTEQTIQQLLKES